MRVLVVNDRKTRLVYKVVHETYTLNKWGYPEFDKETGIIGPGKQEVVEVRVQDPAESIPLIKFWDKTVLITYANFKQGPTDEDDATD